MKKGRKSSFINLVYWKSIPPNFGDILSPFIISKLSGCDIHYKKLYSGTFANLKNIIKCVLRFKLSEIRHILFFWQKNILGIGSILAHGNRNSIIWGSGFISSDEKFRGGIVCAVRGKYSNERLKELGFAGTSVFGDPALLLPLLINPASQKKDELGIIPHMIETEYFKEKYGGQYKIIDLRTSDVEHIVSEITSCKYVLSTSLHGLIVSHAYGVPALWIRRNKLYGDNIKFADYFSSVNIGIYDGFVNVNHILSSDTCWHNLFKQYKDRSLPNCNVADIQSKLLEAAPFILKKDK